MYSLMQYSIAFHIIALVLWLGGLMVITRTLKLFACNFPAEANSGLDGLRSINSRIWFGFVIPGAVLSIVTGLYQIYLMGISYYMKQGWFHAKLTLVLVLLVVTFFVGREVGRSSKKLQLDAKRLLILHIISATSLLIIVFLTILGRSAV